MTGASSPAANAVAEWTKVSVTVDGQEIDVSSIDSATFQEFLMGRLNWKMTVEGNWYPGDTNGQAAMMTAMLARTLTYFKVKKVTGGPNLSGAGYIKMPSLDITAGASVDAQKIRFEIRGTGILAYSAT